jgi:excisionase family DNA binding protein
LRWECAFVCVSSSRSVEVVASVAVWVWVAVSRPPFLGAFVSGSSAWVIHQILHQPLAMRIRQLSVDPHVPAEVVRDLRMTAAAIGEAARQYRVAVTSVADSAEVSGGGVGGDSVHPPLGGVDTCEAAVLLNCSERWIRALIAQGRLAAAKQGRSWFVDLDSIEDYRRREAA